MAAGTTFKVAAIFQAFDKMTAPLRNINNKLNRFQKAMKTTGTTTAKTSVGMVGSFKSITTGIIGASVAFAIWDKLIIGTIKRGAELEQTLVQAGAKFGRLADVVPGTAAFTKLENAALKAGLTTEFTAAQSAGALKTLAQAGLGLEQAISTLPAVIDFATASGLELEQATSISADAIGAFGSNIRDLAPQELKAKMAELNDIMVITANTFNTSVEEMFQASTKGALVLNKIIGASGFQFAALVGNIASGGVKAEIAGRGLRAAFLKMTSGVPKVNKALRTIGVSLTDETGKFKDVITIIGELRTGLGGIRDESKRLALKNILFGRVGLVQMGLILNRTEAQLRATTAAMAAQRGEVRRIALLVRATLTGVWIKFMSSMEGLGLILFTKIKPALKILVVGMNKISSAIAESGGPLLNMIGLMLKLFLVSKTFAIIGGIFKLAFKAGPWFVLISLLATLIVQFPQATKFFTDNADAIFFIVTAIVASVKAIKIWRAVTTTAIGLTILWESKLLAQAAAARIAAGATTLATKATKGFTVALAVLLSPIVLVAAAISAVIVGIAALIIWWDKVVIFFEENFFTAAALMTPFIGFIALLKNFLPNAVKNVFNIAKNMFTSTFGFLASFFGFGDEEDIEVRKSTDVNLNNNLDDIVASPAIVAATRINGQINVNFDNLPEGANVSKPEQDDNSTGLILSTSGS